MKPSFLSAESNQEFLELVSEVVRLGVSKGLIKGIDVIWNPSDWEGEGPQPVICFSEKVVVVYSADTNLATLALVVEKD